MLNNEGFNIGDRVYINQPIQQKGEDIRVSPGQMATVVETNTEYRGCVKIKMDYEEYEVYQPNIGMHELTWWGPFELVIATSKIYIAVEENREEKIKKLLDDN